MKKKTQNFSQSFKMPHLFREDLENIEIVIKSLSPREYKLETKDFEYNSVEEIPKDTNAENNFDIQVHCPSYISINFDKSNADIYTSDDDLEIVGAVKKITDIILKKERKFLWFLAKLAWGIIPLIVGWSFGKIATDQKEISRNEAFLTLAIIILSILLFIWGFYTIYYKFSLVEFKYQKDKPNFFIKNKDQIIVGIIVGIIVAFISVLLTLLLLK